MWSYFAVENIINNTQFTRLSWIQHTYTHTVVAVFSYFAAFFALHVMLSKIVVYKCLFGIKIYKMWTKTDFIIRQSSMWHAEQTYTIQYTHLFVVRLDCSVVRSLCYSFVRIACYHYVISRKKKETKIKTLKNWRPTEYLNEFFFCALSLSPILLLPIFFSVCYFWARVCGSVFGPKRLYNNIYTTQYIEPCFLAVYEYRIFYLASFDLIVWYVCMHAYVRACLAFFRSLFVPEN